MEMNMTRWMHGIKLDGRKRSKELRELLGLEPVSLMIKESRRRWFWMLRIWKTAVPCTLKSQTLVLTSVTLLNKETLDLRLLSTASSYYNSHSKMRVCQDTIMWLSLEHITNRKSTQECAYLQQRQCDSTVTLPKWVSQLYLRNPSSPRLVINTMNRIWSLYVMAQSYIEIQKSDLVGAFFLGLRVLETNQFQMGPKSIDLVDILSRSVHKFKRMKWSQVNSKFLSWDKFALSIASHICSIKVNNWRAPWKNRICSTIMKLRKSLGKPVTWQNILHYSVLPHEIVMHDAFNVRRYMHRAWRSQVEEPNNTL